MPTQYAETEAPLTQSASGVDALLRRERLLDCVFEAFRLLAEQAFRHGDVRLCIACCEQLLEDEPCREDAYRLLMLCTARLGETEQVHMQFQRCERSLMGAFGYGPSARTIDLYQKLVN